MAFNQSLEKTYEDVDYYKVDTLPSDRTPRCINPSKNRNKFSEFVKNNPNLPLSDFKLLRQIGSDSAHGIVYEAKYKYEQQDFNMAIKFMPRYKGDTCKEELVIAKELGTRAMNDPTLPFPIFVGGGNARIPFPKESQKAYDIGKEAVKRKVFKEKKSKPEALRACVKATEEDFPEEVDAVYLISELAVEDVQQSENPFKYYKGMHCSLDKLHEFGYIHGDPHLGNFLILKDGSVIIHDFGSSGAIGSHNSITEDFKFWRNALNKYEKRPPKRQCIDEN